MHNANRSRQYLLLLFLALQAACQPAEQENPGAGVMERGAMDNRLDTMPATSASVDPGAAAENPLLTTSSLDLEFPPFDRLQTVHFLPAFEQGMAQQLAEARAIAAQRAEPDFVNTIVALESSGQLLHRVSAIFNNLVRAHSDDSLRALQQQVSPLLARHDDQIVLDPALFRRIDRLYARRGELGLDAESLRLLEKYHSDFVRAGALLDEAGKQSLQEINGELALLQTLISQQILAESNRLAIVVRDPADLAGLDARELRAAADRAQREQLESAFVLSLQNTSQQPVLSQLDNRDLRQYIMEVSTSRNTGGEFDNRELVSRLLRLRAEKARLLGYETYAQFILQNQTAGDSATVDARLRDLMVPALARWRDEAAALQQQIHREGGDFALRSWDWAYYAEQLSRASNQLDARVLRQYFELNNVLHNGVFLAANRLYGVSFEERHDLPVYHPDVRVFEVRDATGTMLALFIADYLQRPSKRGGAWSSTYVAQSGLLDQRPVVANHMNIPAAAAGEPVLLTLAEVKTMFHEFGHALHNIFSDVTYPYFSGSRVPRDFVEFPSQLNEMWALWPEVMDAYARHYETGAVMPESMQQALRESGTFNQGFLTSEYLAAAMLDMAAHRLLPEQVPPADQLLDFEMSVLADLGLDQALLPPRYRITYFNHILGGYAAGYYSYIWAEVLDADAEQWFRGNGGLTRENGSHFRRSVLAAGGSRDAMQLYREFRGGEPSLQPLLQRRGLINQQTE